MPDSEQDYEQLTSLLGAVAADLRLPLLQIKSRLELMDGIVASASDSQSLSISAAAGLRLIEAFMYTTEMPHARQLPLEPVSVGVLLDEAAHNLEHYADHYNTRIMISPSSSRLPVLTHKRSAVIALTCLAESLVRGQAGQYSAKRYGILFGARSQRGSVVSGVYGQLEGLSNSALRRARQLAGRSQQSVGPLPVGSGSGILIADQLFGLISTQLSSSRHQKLNGLAVRFPLSSQLNLL